MSATNCFFPSLSNTFASRQFSSVVFVCPSRFSSTHLFACFWVGLLGLFLRVIRFYFKYYKPLKIYTNLTAFLVGMELFWVICSNFESFFSWFHQKLQTLDGLWSKSFEKSLDEHWFGKSRLEIVWILRLFLRACLNQILSCKRDPACFFTL